VWCTRIPIYSKPNGRAPRRGSIVPGRDVGAAPSRSAGEGKLPRPSRFRDRRRPTRGPERAQLRPVGTPIFPAADGLDGYVQSSYRKSIISRIGMGGGPLSRHAWKAVWAFPAQQYFCVLLSLLPRGCLVDEKPLGPYSGFRVNDPFMANRPCGDPADS
jgi:hypothetical protein